MLLLAINMYIIFACINIPLTFINKIDKYRDSQLGHHWWGQRNDRTTYTLISYKLITQTIIFPLSMAYSHNIVFYHLKWASLHSPPTGSLLHISFRILMMMSLVGAKVLPTISIFTPFSFSIVKVPINGFLGHCINSPNQCPLYMHVLCLVTLQFWLNLNLGFVI